MSVFSKLRACLVAGFALAAVSAPAFADLAAFNRATLQGDFSSAALAALETWPTLDHKRPEIAVIAREFAWMSMLAGRPSDAQTYTLFLTGTPGLSDPTPTTSKILHAWATFRLTDQPESRAAFLAVLRESLKTPGTDLVALAAANDLAGAGEASAMAIVDEHRSRRPPLMKQREAELVAIVNAFDKKREAAPYLAMIQLDEALFSEAMNPAYIDLRDQLFALHDQAWAWRMTMESLLRASRTGYPVADTKHFESRAREFRAPGAKAPCFGDMKQTAEIKFPFKERKGWLTGAVIVSMNINEQGNVTDARVLAAVPPDSGFNDAVLAAARQWAFEPHPDVEQSKCTIARANQLQAVQFGFGMAPQ